MTPAQQTALEAVAGRALSAEEIATIAPLLPNRKDIEIAALLSVGRTRLCENKIGLGTILAVMRPNGGVFLDELKAMAETDTNIYWTLELIKTGGLDVGMRETREELQNFAAGHPAMAAAVAALLKTAEVSDPIHYNVVSDALNRAEGRLAL